MKNLEHIVAGLKTKNPWSKQIRPPLPAHYWLFPMVAILLLATPAAKATTYDLNADWSNSSNPNGVWSYNEGTNPLPFQANWGNAGTFTGAQPAWARSAGTAPR